MFSRNDKGYTLIELIVSIALALFAATLILSGYTHLFKGIHLQTRRADTVREMVLARKAVTRAFDSLETITLLSPDRVMFTQKGSSESHTLEFHDSTLFKDSREIVKRLKTFILSSTEKKTADGHQLVQWECTFRDGGWAGGVCITRN